MQEYNLKIDNGPTKYDPNRDPRVSNEFATVFFFAEATDDVLMLMLLLMVLLVMLMLMRTHPRPLDVLM